MVKYKVIDPDVEVSYNDYAYEGIIRTDSIDNIAGFVNTYFDDCEVLFVNRKLRKTSLVYSKGLSDYSRNMLRGVIAYDGYLKDKKII